MKRLDSVIREYYLDYVNNWLTVDSFASHHEISISQASVILAIGRELQEQHASICKQIKALQGET